MPKKSEAFEVFVFEARRRWAPELARQWFERSVRVRGFDNLAALRATLTGRTPAIVVLELEAAPADCLRWLSAQTNDWPRPAIVVIGSSRTAELESLVRELGAAEFAPDTIGGESLARICQRLHATHQAPEHSHA
jgi:DNA-binding NtrC family response regulator